MSLEFEGAGDTCLECGVFDFLPTLCSHCHGVFCRDHAHQHHVYADLNDPSGQPPSRTDAWCTPPWARHDVPRQDVSTASAEAAVTTPAASCYLCPSTWCVLSPCPRCGHHFCAAHRFHGHEEEDENAAAGHASTSEESATTALDGARLRRFTPAVVPPSLQRHKAEAPHNALTVACAPHTTSQPLRLAPPAYHSRMMELVVILCRNDQSAKDAHEDEAETHWELGVCSLSVAVEATIGQLMQRCLGVLHLAGPHADSMDAPQLMSLCACSCPFKMEATTTAAGGAARVQLHLRELPLSSVTRHVLSSGEAFVIRVGAEAECARGGDVHSDSSVPSTLTAVLSRLLFTSARADPLVGAYEYVVKDDRVRAAVTRLRLHAAVVAEPSEPAAVGLAQGCEGDHAPEVVELPPTAATGPSPAPVESLGESAPWPFHALPPLSSMAFHNSKASPLGTKQLPASSGSRALVAVFTQDKGITEHLPIPPFVLAVSKDWLAGKLAERVKDEAYQLLSNPKDRQAAVGGSGNKTPSRPFADYTVFVLASATAAAPTAASDAAPAVPLSQCSGSAPLVKDGDVLFLGTASACAPGSALMQEVDRMRRAKGKELSAQKLEMMKKCTVM